MKDLSEEEIINVSIAIGVISSISGVREEDIASLLSGLCFGEEEAGRMIQIIKDDDFNE